MLRSSFIYNILQKVFGKLIFYSILLFLPLPPIFNIGCDFTDLLAEQETFLEPTLATLSSTGSGGVVLTERTREGSILEVWKMVHFHMNQYQGHDKNLSCVANRLSLIKVQAKYLTLYLKCTLYKLFQKHFWRRLSEKVEKNRFCFFLKLHISFDKFSGFL